jgi:hypothetical protein
MRGGDWYYSDLLSSSLRTGKTLGERTESYGFRIVREP